jgi:hypothetical protein
LYKCGIIVHYIKNYAQKRKQYNCKKRPYITLKNTSAL